MDKLMAIAANQHGLFTRAQAHACKVSDGMLRRRVANGTLIALSHRVLNIAVYTSRNFAVVRSQCAS